MTTKYLIDKDELYPYYTLTERQRQDVILDIPRETILKIQHAERLFNEAQYILQEYYFEQRRPVQLELPLDDTDE